MAELSNIISSILGGSLPSPAAQAPQPLPPEDSIVSPNPAQPLPPDTRMEGYRRLFTNFTFGLGSGLEAASASPRGQAQRTQAGMGAALKVPMALQVAQQAQKERAQEMALKVAQLRNSESNTASLEAQRIGALANTAEANRLKQLADQGRIAAENENLALKQKIADAQGKRLNYFQTPAGLYFTGGDDPSKAGIVDQTKPLDKNIEVTDAIAKAFGLDKGLVGQEYPAASLNAMISASKPDFHAETLADGTPNGGVYSIDLKTGAKNRLGDARPQASANSGAGLTTATINDPDNPGMQLPVVVNKTTGEAKPMTINGQIASKSTAQITNRAAQAVTAANQADHILSLIDKAPNSVGPILGRIAKGETNLGNVSPEAKALGTALGQFSALMPILHGFRGGGQTVEHFDSVIGDLHINAAALKASIQEVKNLTTQIKAEFSRLPQGNGAKLTDPKIVQQFLNLSGNDKDAARALASEKGWIF